MIDTLLHWIGDEKSLTFWSIVVLTLANGSTQLVPVPRFVPGFVAGAAYGWASLPIVVIGTTAGALAAFLLARYVAADWARRMIERRPKVHRIADAVAAEGWRLVALSRLGVPIPSSVTNFLFGITTIGLWPYTWSTLVFCIPQALLFVALGAAGHIALVHDEESDLNKALLVVGVLSCAAAIYFISKRAKASTTFDSPDKP
jgi:uncharacterized membrane protein YdjX (TVP38/TMEM64 family)